MQPNIFKLVKDLPSITSDNITRFFPFASAGENPKMPYATWQTLNGSTDYYISNCKSDADTFSFQVDVWAKTDTECLKVAKEIRELLEIEWFLDFMGGAGKDFETGLFRYIMRFAGRQFR